MRLPNFLRSGLLMAAFSTLLGRTRGEEHFHAANQIAGPGFLPLSLDGYRSFRRGNNRHTPVNAKARKSRNAIQRASRKRNRASYAK